MAAILFRPQCVLMPIKIKLQYGEDWQHIVRRSRIDRPDTTHKSKDSQKLRRWDQQTRYWPGPCWMRKFPVKIHVSRQEISNLAFDWLAALPRNAMLSYISRSTLAIGPPGTKFGEIWTAVQSFLLTNMYLKMSSVSRLAILFPPQCANDIPFVVCFMKNRLQRKLCLVPSRLNPKLNINIISRRLILSDGISSCCRSADDPGPFY